VKIRPGPLAQEKSHSASVIACFQVSSSLGAAPPLDRFLFPVSANSDLLDFLPWDRQDETNDSRISDSVQETFVLFNPWKK
jgi:hypothetical protein